jgi:hypothetical protein
MESTKEAVKKYLNRNEAAEYLRGIGVRASPATLAGYVSRGGGPRFLKLGPRVLYTTAYLDQWAESSVVVGDE